MFVDEPVKRIRKAAEARGAEIVAGDEHQAIRVRVRKRPL
jgi:hypothetical protein